MTIVQQLVSRPATDADTTWRDHAGCRFANPDLFFPPAGAGAAVEQVEAAKSVCQGCEVRNPCLQFAFETRQEAGIWGGTTEDERRRLRRAWLADRRRHAG